MPEIDNLEPTELPPFPTDLSETIRNIVGNPEVSSKDWVIRQYDHEVRGATAIKPIQGKIGKEVHGDSSVLKPVEDFLERTCTDCRY